MEEEVKVSCTQGLLLCLSAKDRLVYILSEILEFNSREGAEILGISPDNYRKKLSRSRLKIRNFLNKRCGLVKSENPCRCSRKIDFLIDQKVVEPKNLRYAQFTKRSIDLVSQIGQLEKSVAIYRSTPNISTPNAVINALKEIISTDKP